MEGQPEVDLSKKEQDIMRVLWDVGQPLSVSDICDHAEMIGFSLNQSTVQMTVNKLQKKGLIRVGQITQNYKALARAFEPEITADDFAVMQLRRIIDGAGKHKKSSFIAALIDDEDLTKEDMDELIAKIESIDKE